MKNSEITAAIEGILFAAGDPVPAARIASVLGIDIETLFENAKKLSDYYDFERRGIRLVRIQDSLQLCSAPELAGEIGRALESRKPPRLTQTALEVLAIVAYFQPVTRAYVDNVRGVDSSYTMGMLSERGLIEPCGRLDVPGRPTLFKTSGVFLRTMGIESLDELPELPDLGTDEGLDSLRMKINAMQQDDGENGVQLIIPEDSRKE